MAHPRGDLLERLSACQYPAQEVTPNEQEVALVTTRPSGDLTSVNNASHHLDDQYRKGDPEPIRPPMNAGRGRRSGVARRAGRPRLDAPGAATLSDDRRKQIRRAQKTYRQKKEAALQSSKLQAEQLEDKLNKVTDTFRTLHDDARQARLNTTHPSLFRSLTEMHRLLLSDEDPPVPSSGQSTEGVSASDPTAPSGNFESCQGYYDQKLAFGYRVSQEPNRKPSQGCDIESSLLRPHDWEGSRLDILFDHHIERPFGSQRHHTYSFHETDFSRRLHRFSLEYAFGLFSEPDLDRSAAKRMFRLVGCIQDKPKMYPYFRRLVRADAGDSLEIATIPFYSIGGAGTHYPRSDESGNPVYPSKMRLPGRLLGLPASTEFESEASFALARQAVLDGIGFGGEWFDSGDVEGFLRSKGVDMDVPSEYRRVHDSTGYVVEARVNTTTVHGQPRLDHPNFSQRIGESDHIICPSTYSEMAGMNNAPKGTSPLVSTVPMWGKAQRSVVYTFEIEVFLDLLLPGLAMLGRAPGFRRSVVESAFQYSLRLETLGSCLETCLETRGYYDSS
ncbi:hypothetical protein GQ53DRAFT_847151 [Thozetella sp. PMI_491]|nr:hypothetical protein GQ53DRAFT_847151 [Thozetella sp. PMI_491]